jgi:hypothetical protein
MRKAETNQVSAATGLEAHIHHVGREGSSGEVEVVCCRFVIARISRREAGATDDWIVHTKTRMNRNLGVSRVTSLSDKQRNER